MSEALLQTAQYLTERPDGSASSDLCASISTTYCALFETLAKLTADLFVGTESPERAEKAWNHIYRSLEHTRVALKCSRTTAYKFPQSVVDFSKFFITMQKKREKSDYEYGYSPDLISVRADIEIAKLKIKSLLETNPKHLRAFCVFILVDKHRHEDNQDPKNSSRRN